MRDGPHSNSQDDQNTSRVISIRQRGNLWDSALQNLPGAGCGYNRAHDMAQTHAHWAGSPAASSARADSCAGCLRDARIQRLSTFQMPPRSARLPHEPCGRLCPERKIDANQKTQPVAANNHACPIALTVSSAQSARPSNHEGGLAAVSQISPSPCLLVLWKGVCARDPDTARAFEAVQSMGFARKQLRTIRQDKGGKP